MRVVVALGGNALLRRGEAPESAAQRRNVDSAVASIAELAREHEVVLTHGNGPQVGLLALQSEAYTQVPAYPLDVLGAESEGMIGYLLEQGLRNELPGREVATLLTQVVVDLGDPAFGAPTKPIGSVYAESDARRLAAERGWAIAPDGDGFRRVVASPEPLEIVELDAIRMLLDGGVLPICVGGGGIPVSRNGTLAGVEAVIDKDKAAGLLAERLGADALLLLTDVEAVELGWGTPDARPLGTVSVGELREHVFAPGSMAPKVAAACRFVEQTGGKAAIGALDRAAEILAGSSGTTVVAGVLSRGSGAGRL
jgi:carbamate kinase